MNVTLTYDATVRLVAMIAGAGVVVSAFQDIIRSRVFVEGGLLDWDVSRLGQRWSTTGASGRMLDLVCANRRVGAVLWARATVALLTVAAAIAGWHAPVLWALLAMSYAVMFVRNAEGHDGAQQMIFLIFLSLALLGLNPPDSVLARVCLWFIAAQAGLAYVVAGVTKLRSPSWRDGTALAGILGTTAYGADRIHRLLRRNPRVGWLLSWTVIVFECGFPVVFLLDPPLTVALLTAGLSFHAATAVLMGLNGFLPAFVATYPAVLFTAQAIG